MSLVFVLVTTLSIDDLTNSVSAAPSLKLCSLLSPAVPNLNRRPGGWDLYGAELPLLVPVLVIPTVSPVSFLLRLGVQYSGAPQLSPYLLRICLGYRARSGQRACELLRVAPL